MAHGSRLIRRWVGRIELVFASLNRRCNFFYLTKNENENEYWQSFGTGLMLRFARAWGTQPSRVYLRKVTLQTPLAPHLFLTANTACSSLRYSTMSDSEGEAFDLNGASGGSDSDDFRPPTKKVR